MNEPVKTVKIGDRVFYKDNDRPTKDIGTVVNIVLASHPFVVKWDNDPETAKLDRFSGDQLGFV